MTAIFSEFAACVWLINAGAAITAAVAEALFKNFLRLIFMTSSPLVKISTTPTKEPL
jgi:hypothetical protein